MIQPILMGRWLVSEILRSEACAPGWVPGWLGWSQRRVAGGIVVHLAGELDLSNSAELRQRLMKVVESGRAAVVVLDLSNVSFIDAGSAGVIVEAWTAARCCGRRLVVDGLRGTPALVFGLLGLEPLLARRMREDKAGGDAGDL
jgi:anti-anti-sigma factor